jgi:hypothetical protein
MNHFAYLELCRQTGLLLDLEDPARLGTNLPVMVDGVQCQAIYTEGLHSVLLLAEVGPVSSFDKAAVYEQLLEMQLMYWSLPDLRFGFHRSRGTVVLCMTLPLGDAATPETFADLVRSAAGQVASWKQELLAGKVGTSDEIDALLAAMTMESGEQFGSAAV